MFTLKHVVTCHGLGSLVLHASPQNRARTTTIAPADPHGPFQRSCPPPRERIRAPRRIRSARRLQGRLTQNHHSTPNTAPQHDLSTAAPPTAAPINCKKTPVPASQSSPPNRLQCGPIIPPGADGDFVKNTRRGGGKPPLSALPSTLHRPSSKNLTSRKSLTIRAIC